MNNNFSKLSSGGKNLVLLGIGAILVASLTTAVSLYLYHDSGDIYLDRSRPGFLPEKEETEQEKDDNKDYSFSDYGAITEKTLDEYLENLEQELDRLNSFSGDPFSLDSLSNNALGIPAE
ncbi:hypothetical protein IJH66_02005 [Candidatus Saccharibacteria bacterium]|nr:hypothetical protein [Candidatus Saccharibacteria bacterium]MBQ6605737.1 hypothetical protein [Candidatus Saccharibacteria bacterium]